MIYHNSNSANVYYFTDCQFEQDDYGNQYSNDNNSYNHYNKNNNDYKL